MNEDGALACAQLRCELAGRGPRARRLSSREPGPERRPGLGSGRRLVPWLRFEDNRLEPARVRNVEPDISVVAWERDDVKGGDDDLRGDEGGIGVSFVDEHDKRRRGGRAFAPRAGHFDREPRCGMLARKDRRHHPGFEIDFGRRGIRARVRRPDGAERPPIADQKAARLDEPAVVASGDGSHVSHQRTVNSTSRAAVPPFDRSDFASTRRT